MAVIRAASLGAHAAARDAKENKAACFAARAAGQAVGTAHVTQHAYGSAYYSLKAIAEADPANVYWMSRDQRVNDNWALLYARELAQKHDSPLAVAFCLAPQFLGATGRQYRFLLQGLKEVEKNLQALNIPFYLLRGDPGKEMPHLLSGNWRWSSGMRLFSSAHKPGMEELRSPARRKFPFTR